MRRLFLLTITFSFMVSCTENPFANKDDNQIVKEKLSGEINLADGVTPDGIFVWLNEFNLSTYTDEKGEFSITLPLPENQAGGNGFDGIFTLYFFMGNYKADSVAIELSQGKILENQDNITNDGALKNTIDLYPMLTLQGVIGVEEEDFVQIQFDTDSVFKKLLFNLRLYDETEVIYSLREDRKWPAKGFFRTGMIFEPVENGHDPVFVKSTESELYHDALLLDSTYSWTYELMLYRDNFEEIEYTAFPYLIIDHPYLPENLWDALGREKTNFDEHFFDYPFKRSGTKVQVIKK